MRVSGIYKPVSLLLLKSITIKNNNKTYRKLYFGKTTAIIKETANPDFTIRLLL